MPKPFPQGTPRLCFHLNPSCQHRSAFIHRGDCRNENSVTLIWFKAGCQCQPGALLAAPFISSDRQTDSSRAAQPSQGCWGKHHLIQRAAPVTCLPSQLLAAKIPRINCKKTHFPAQPAFPEGAANSPASCTPLLWDLTSNTGIY